jgi:hypothetical protein
MTFEQAASFLGRDSGTSLDPQGVRGGSARTGAASGKTMPS